MINLSSNDMKSNLTGIILAGGQSQRMGLDKGLAEFCGKALIMNAIEILKPLCSDIIISTNNPDYEKFGYSTQQDLFRDAGPMGGIFSALSVSKTEMNFILSCDMPLIPGELVQYILSKSKEKGVFIPLHGRSLVEPLCGTYTKSNLELLFNYIKEHKYKLMDFLKKASVTHINITKDLPFYHKNLFLNVNNPADLGKAEAILNSGL